MHTAKIVETRLQAMGLPPTAQVNRSSVEATGPGSVHLSTRAAQVNILAIPQVAWQTAPWLAEAGMEEINQAAATLAQATQRTLPFADTFSRQPLPVFAATNDLGQNQPPDYQADPTGWVARFIVLPALQHHLIALPAINRADDAAAQAFANEAIHVARDDRLRYRLIAELTGIQLDAQSGSLEADGVRIRSLSASERGNWLDERGGMSPALLRTGEIWPPEVAVELDESGPRDSASGPDRDRVQVIVGALQLHGYWVAGRFYRVESIPPWLRPIRNELPLTVPGGHVAERSVLTAKDFHAVMATAQRLAHYNTTQPQSPHDLALHRFFAGEARRGTTDFLPGRADRNAADAILDFTIALEALLLPYDENARHGDLSYRFRIHGAHFIADDIAKRQATAWQLSTIYSVRSRLVHGGRYPTSEEIKSARDNARNLARCGLLRAVRDGFPNAATFNRMTLGISDS